MKMNSKYKDLEKDLIMLFTELIFCMFIVPFFQLFGILFQYRISLIYKYLWVMLFAISHLSNTFFYASFFETTKFSEEKSVLFIILMMLNPYSFALFNVILNWNSKFP
jgi:hypothetical protein